MKVGLVQSSPKFGEVERNVDIALRRVYKADADLIVLPELFNTGYRFRSAKEALRLAEKVDGGPTVERLIEVARAKKAFIVAGLAERAGKKVYNSSVLVGPKGLVGTYRKAHLFSTEKRLFTPGNMPFKVYDIGKAKIGMMICFDWIFPEAARTLALKGADIICHPSNLVLPHCPKAMITRCLENRVFAITANRVGTEARVGKEKLRFIGKSGIVAPDGEVLARANSTRTETCVVEIDPKMARNKQITPKNNILEDRRPAIYTL
jgi:predicted amidohydrolase